MNKEEADALLTKALDDMEAAGYAALAERIGETRQLQVRGGSGSEYQIETSLCWDDRPGGAVRILGSIDDGGLRAFVPLSGSRRVVRPEAAGPVPGPLLARGRTADLHAWEPGWVLKLYHDWFGLEDIEFEARMARAVHASGLPVPAAGGILQVNGRNGLLYERVDGTEMWQALARRPWRLGKYARRMAELHAGMHACRVRAELPAQRDRLVHKIGSAQTLPQNLRLRALAALERLPDGDRICHGDFHPGNILIAPQQDVIIDWIDASRGNPLADVARTTVIALGAVESGQIRQPILRILLRRFHAIYLEAYFRLRPGGREEYRRWLPVVAAARLSEGIRELESWLLREAQDGL